MLKLKRRVKLKGEAYELMYRWNENGAYNSTEMRPNFNMGGEAKSPKMFVLSYPGRERDLLFRILRSMRLDLGIEGDVHVMNDLQKESGYNEVSVPHHWFELFNANKWFKEFLLYLRQDIKSKEYLAPEWFIKDWAKAAVNAAVESTFSGSGIIVLRSWDGYNASPWCEMENLFCKAIASTYPQSVYVITGFDNRLNGSIGHYMENSFEFRKSIKLPKG